MKQNLQENKTNLIKQTDSTSNIVNEIQFRVLERVPFNLFTIFFQTFFAERNKST